METESYKPPEDVGEQVVSGSINIESFCDYYPESKIEEISLSDMPEDIRGFFNRYSNKLYPRGVTEDHLYNIHVINHGGDTISYTVSHLITYSNGDTEESTYIADTEDGVFTGYAELRYNKTNKRDYFKDKPFIGFIRTHEGYKGKGLAQGRIMAMNALAQSMYNNPLYSDTLNSEEMVMVWEGLVEKGKAKKFIEKDSGHDRYVYTY